jgi:hypothetical protein
MEYFDVFNSYNALASYNSYEPSRPIVSYQTRDSSVKYEVAASSQTEICFWVSDTAPAVECGIILELIQRGVGTIHMHLSATSMDKFCEHALEHNLPIILSPRFEPIDFQPLSALLRPLPDAEEIIWVDVDPNVVGDQREHYLQSRSTPRSTLRCADLRHELYVEFCRECCSLSFIVQRLQMLEGETKRRFEWYHDLLLARRHRYEQHPPCECSPSLIEFVCDMYHLFRLLPFRVLPLRGTTVYALERLEHEIGFSSHAPEWLMLFGATSFDCVGEAHYRRIKYTPEYARQALKHTSFLLLMCTAARMRHFPHSRVDMSLRQKEHIEFDLRWLKHTK